MNKVTRTYAPSALFVIAAFTSIQSVGALAAPADPSDKPVRAQFSARVNDEFELLTDTDDDGLLYYIPRRGALAVQSPKSSSPLPRFNVVGITPIYGFFAGQELGSFTGTLSPTGDKGALANLIAEAGGIGYRVVPAPVTEATTRFIANGYVAENGRIDVQCVIEDSGARYESGKPIMVPACKTRQSPNDAYDIGTEVMAKLNSIPLGTGTIGQDVVFSGMLTPTWTNNARALMASGANWDNITASTLWKVKTSRKTRTAQLVLNWKQLYERVDAFVSLHDGRCVDVQIRTFFENVTGCQDADKCGIKIQWIGDNGRVVPTAPSDADFIDVVNLAKDKLQAELFNEVRAASTSQVGNVDTRQNALFVARSNIEKRILTRNETRTVVWNPGFRSFEPHTDMTVQCVSGGFGTPVRWDMENTGCKALIGQ